MIYYKAQYSKNQDNWVDLYAYKTESAEQAYKELVHFVLKSDSSSYLRCRVIKVTEEQIHFDERLCNYEDERVYVD